MNIVSNLMELTMQNVFCITSHQSVFAAFCDNKMKFNTVFSSPLRKDNKPSFVIYERGFFIDFATGDRGDSVDFVMKLNNISFNDALCVIVEKLNLAYRFIFRSKQDIKPKIASYLNPKSNSISVDGCVIDIKVRSFEAKDLEYWSRFNIHDEADLKRFNIFPISHFFLNKKMYIAENLAYAFIENKDGKLTKKIYQPKSKYMKWINNNNSSVWELWNNLPKSHKNIIITSSRKDGVSIIKTLKIPSASLQSESIVPKESVMKELASRFENIYILYDNDIRSEKNWGQIGTEKIISKYPNVINIKIEDKYDAKDFTDFIVKHGTQKVKEYFKNIIKN